MDTGWRQDTRAAQLQLAQQQAAEAPAPDTPITRAAQARAAAADNWQGFNIGDGIHNASSSEDEASVAPAAPLVPHCP